MKEEGFSGCWEGEVLEGNLLMRRLPEGDLLPTNERPAVNLLEAGGCGELRGSRPGIVMSVEATHGLKEALLGTRLMQEHHFGFPAP